MDPIITSSVTAAVVAFATKGVTNAKGPAQFIDDVMELVGFGILTTWADKKRAKREIDISEYKRQIAIEMATVPEDDIQEPNLAIVGPAIEASKYYIEEKEIRDMFAKIVAGSTDKRKNNQIKTSFVEIIKQLDPLDAKHLLQINECISIGKPVPIVTINTIVMVKKQRVSRVLYRNYFLSTTDVQDANAITSSIENLARLKLIDLIYTNSYSDKDAYEEITEIARESCTEYLQDGEEFHISRGIIDITEFGNSFISICL